MSDSFTASPGTFVLIYDPNIPEKQSSAIPVMGWTKGLSGFDPVTVVPEDGRMTFGKAILTTYDDEPFITDPISKMTFNSVEDWVTYMKGRKPVAKPNAETGKRRRTNLFIQFSEKKYVNKSFWHFKTSSDEFLFELEGGADAPDDPRVQKINRDSFYVARKLLDVLTYDDLFNTVKVESSYDVEDFVDDEDLI